MYLQKTEEPHQTHPTRKKQRNKPQLGKKIDEDLRGEEVKRSNFCFLSFKTLPLPKPEPDPLKLKKLGFFC